MYVYLKKLKTLLYLIPSMVIHPYAKTNVTLLIVLVEFEPRSFSHIFKFPIPVNYLDVGSFLIYNSSFEPHLLNINICLI